MNVQNEEEEVSSIYWLKIIKKMCTIFKKLTIFVMREVHNK